MDSPMLKSEEDQVSLKTDKESFRELYLNSNYDVEKPPKINGNGNGNGHGSDYIVIATPEEERDKVFNESLKLSKRAAHSAFQKAGSFNTAYWVLLLEQIRSATRARNASLYLVEDNMLAPKVWLGDWDEDKEPRRFHLGEGIAGTVWSSGDVFVSEGNVQHDPRFQRSDNPRSRKARSLLSVPVFDFHQNVIAVLNLDSNIENRFSVQLKQRIEKVQPKTYQMLRELGLNERMECDELISVFFWALQKAISQNYIVKPRQDASSGKQTTEAVRYNGSMREREPQQTIDDTAELVDPEYIKDVFQEIREELSPGRGKPGRTPVRLERLWSVFEGRENQAISLDEFADAFKEDGSSESRKSAATAISWLNTTLRRWGFGLEIETKQYTTYQIKSKPTARRNRR